MRIANCHVQGYRSIFDSKIDFHNQTAIVGRNSSGKSNLLNAISLFFDLSSQLDEYDYFNKNPQGEIRIRLTFDCLKEKELELFGSYVVDGKLTVTKIITHGGIRYLGSRYQIPEFAEIREKKFRDQQAAIKELRENEEFNDLEGATNSQAAIDASLQEYESSHFDRCRLVDSEAQFLGPTNVGGGSLDNFTKMVVVPAVRDARSELQRQGAIHKLLDFLILRQLAERKDVQELNQEYETKASQIYSLENLTELQELSGAISSSLAKYAPGVQIRIDFGEFKAPKISIPDAVALVAEDGFSCPITHVGHGIQRAVILAVLEQLAIMEGSGDDSPDLVLAIEEPELYLHPTRCRHLRNTLSDLAADHTKSGTQVIYTTHSPQFISIDRFDEIRIAAKIPLENSTISQTKLHWTDVETVVEKIRSVQDEGKGGEFNTEGFCARSETTMTLPVNEGFFADAVVLVEGYSDVAALETVAECLGLDWCGHGISVIPVQGKNNICTVLSVFESLLIPVYFCFDGDAGCSNSEKENHAEKNRCLQRILNSTVVDFPTTTVTEKFTVFEKDLESELKCIDETYFLRIREAIANNLAVTTHKQAMKKPAGMRAYIERAFADQKLPKAIVKAVEEISKLCSKSSTTK